MKGMFKKILVSFAQIFLTALMASLIAYVQNWLAIHGADSSIKLNPETTGVTGGIVGSVKVAFVTIKNRIW